MRKGYIKEVNQLIVRTALKESAVYRYAKWAASSYALGGYINEANLLQLMSCTDAQELRKCIVEEYVIDLLKLREFTYDENLSEPIIEEYILHHLEPLIKRAAKINQLMREKSLNFDQAIGYLSTAANVWAFKGQQLVIEGKIPAEIYFHIFSFISGCSVNDSVKIIDAANQKLRDDVVSAPKTGWFSWFKAQDSLAKLEIEAEERYQSRMKPFAE